MKHNIVESIIGALVIFVAGSFLFISYKSGNLAPRVDGYTLRAQFTEIGSLNIGSDVRLSGIKVGTVTTLKLDPINYSAVVEMSMNDSVKLPKDSSIAIVSDGLLGSKYVAIVPGAEEAMLSSGDLITFTQDAVSLESLIAKFAFGGVSDKDKDNAAQN